MSAALACTTCLPAPRPPHTCILTAERHLHEAYMPVPVSAHCQAGRAAPCHGRRRRSSKTACVRHARRARRACPVAARPGVQAARRSAQRAARARAQVFDDKATFAEWFGDALGRGGPGGGPGGGGGDEWLETEKRVVVIHRLHQILEPFMLRRQVADVEGRLPPKVEPRPARRAPPPAPRPRRPRQQRRGAVLCAGREGALSERRLCGQPAASVRTAGCCVRAHRRGGRVRTRQRPGRRAQRPGGPVALNRTSCVTYPVAAGREPDETDHTFLKLQKMSWQFPRRPAWSNRPPILETSSPARRWRWSDQ